MENAVDTHKDFFISYTKADHQWAEWIAWLLEEAGYSTVFHTWDSGLGTHWVQDMDDAMQEAKRTIAILSPDYLSSFYVQVEWQSAFMQDPQGRMRLLLPMRVRECNVRGILAAIGYIDLVCLDEQEAKERILRGLRLVRNKPINRPIFPGFRETTFNEHGLLEATQYKINKLLSSTASLK